ncbi:MAG TPA: radical SAM family heme chaperone HemW [Pyrinomonadaceae bacterium]|nr:radical SAM family heme chaperone HemW [Pyrinomonadaceae bacterium]
MLAGVYLHIPFCKSRCSYCDFATDVYRNHETVEKYVDALCDEIPGSSAGWQCAADTIYFGGGTPSLLTSTQVERIIEIVDSYFDISVDAEITMEMNPATVMLETLREYRSLGVNRASFGVQTFNERDLKLLARGHDANDARQTFRMLREAGFENVSFDLIAGLPEQTMHDWKRNLEEAIAMQPEHLSLYLLEIHEATPLAEQLRTGRRALPDEELAAEMYEIMIDRLAAAGYVQYEISNFAKPGFESRHNSKYWTLDPVYGFGVSAHSFDGFQRYSNERDTSKYVARVENYAGAEVMRERIDAASEFIFLGLRLNEGIDLAKYRERFGIDLIDKYADAIDRLYDTGLLQITGNRLQLTRKGMLFSNEVFAEFV